MNEHVPLFDKNKPIPMGESRYSEDFNLTHILNIYMNESIRSDAKVAFGNFKIRGLKVMIDCKGQQWIVLKS